MIRKIGSFLLIAAGLVVSACRPHGPQVVQYGDNSGITFRTTEPDLNNWRAVGDVWCDKGPSPGVGYSASANRQECYQQMRKMAAAKDAEIIVLTNSQMGQQGCPGCVSFAGTAYRRVQRQIAEPSLDAGSPTQSTEPSRDSAAMNVDAGSSEAGRADDNESSKRSVKARLESLNELKEDGLISEAEYEAKREEILNDL